MSGINQHSVLGRIGKIETRYTPDNKAVVNMSLAVSENWTDKNTGEKQEKTDWIRVVVFGKPGEIIGKYANKGDKIYIQGKVVTRKYTDSAGIEKYTTETVVDGFNGKFELLGTKPAEQPAGPQGGQKYQQAGQRQQTQKPQQQNRPVPPPPNQPQGVHTANDFVDDFVPF